MNELALHNGSRLNGQSPSNAQVPATVSQKERFLAAVDDNTSLQQVLATISTPAGRLLKTISKALGPAEAEIEFVEKITIREK